MKKILLIITCLSLSSPAFCQELTAADTLEIQRQARYCIIQLGDILNQLAKPDEYFRKNNLDNLLRKFYEDNSLGQIFRDSLVLIEDDLNPNSRPPTFEEEKTIQRYLNDFFQFYEKSVNTSVIFSDIQVSEIRKGEYLYVNVTYENEFLNRHKIINKPYEKYKRIATIKAELRNTGWKMLITYIGYFKTPTLQREDATAFSKDVNQLPAEVTAKEKQAPEKTKELLPAAGTQKDSFSEVQESYKRGGSFDISWKQDFENPVNLSLYQTNTHKASLSPAIAKNEYAGTIPKKVKPGKAYNFQLYDPVTKTSMQSGYFTVRRKFPLGLQIPVYIGVGVGAFFLINELTGNGGKGGGSEPFPTPPDPVEN